MISCFTKAGATRLRDTYIKMGWKVGDVHEGGHGWQFSVEE